MSLESWKAEFYPIEAAHVTDEKEAVEHSILKWIGLREENLEKHDVCKDKYKSIIRDNDGFSMRIAMDNCALCQIFLNKDGILCDKCPYVRHHNIKCFGWPGAPYEMWIGWSDPEPMIKALEALR